MPTVRRLGLPGCDSAFANSPNPCLELPPRSGGSSRHDFGYCALDILYAYAEDSGTYMCKATNKLGEAVNTCSVEVSSKAGLVLDSQHPEGWEKMKTMESRSQFGRLEVQDIPVGPPHFVTQLMVSCQNL